MIDPLTLEIFWSRLIATVNEQATSLMRTAFSATVAEAGDLSACVFDPRGYMIAQAVTGTPGHINSMARCIRHFLDEIPAQALNPGDVLVTNDPWKTSGHFHDITVVTPIFRTGTDGDAPDLVAFFGTICHVADIGGRPFSADAREVYEEGLHIPISRLFRGGVPNDDLLRIIRANVREPDAVVGDLYAMATSNDVGGARLLEFLDEFGLTSVVPLADEVIARSEAAMRDAIRAVPDGTYRHALVMDGYAEALADGTVREVPVTLACAVTVHGDTLSVDFEGTSPEAPRGINVVMNYTEAYTTFGIKCALAPDVPNNEGSFRPVTITAPPGSILNCQPPAPVAGRHIVGQWLPAVVHGALAQAIPDRVIADGSSSLWITGFTGTTRATDEAPRRPFSMLFFNSGGTGARPTKDGLSSTAFPSGVRGVPAEIVEARSPLLVMERSLRTDSGGPGRWRGGLGHRLVVRADDRAVEGDLRFAPFFDRTRVAAPGRDGGHAGGLGDFSLRPGTNTSDTAAVQRPHPKATTFVSPGTDIIMDLPGGGGIGDPRDRDPAHVAADVRDGYVSPESSLHVYARQP
ncbi:MAG: hydantoinase B/oxoprolinase family protein [Chloroflexota bacterium]